MESLSLHRGYSLVELLVVLAIVGLITVMAMTSQGDFNKSMTLVNTAYDIALTIRSVEQMGVGTRSVGTVTNVPYGIHFPVNSSQFTEFADTNGGAVCGVSSLPTCKSGDGKFTQGADSSIGTYQLGNGITFSDMCVSDNWSTGSRCYSTGGLSNGIDIVFARPSVAAQIRTYDSENHFITVPFANACLKVTAPQGQDRSVKIGPSGLILASASSCP